MTIDQVREAAIQAEPVRRLVEAAPSADELRSAISEGLDAIGEGLESVATQLARPAPTRRSPWPAIAIVGVAVGLVIGLLVLRSQRAAVARLRERAMQAGGRLAARVPGRETVPGADAEAAPSGETATAAARDTAPTLHAIPIETGEGLPHQDGIPAEAAVAGQS
jgi:hypothetical protein